jgi:stage V sporulation protein G
MSYSSCKVHIINDAQKTKARVSLLVGGVMYVTGLKVIEGKNGLFVGMSTYKNNAGEYVDIFYPASKDERAKLQAYVLEEYEKALG